MHYRPELGGKHTAHAWGFGTYTVKGKRVALVIKSGFSTIDNHRQPLPAIRSELTLKWITKDKVVATERMTGYLDPERQKKSHLRPKPVTGTLVRSGG